MAEKKPTRKNQSTIINEKVVGHLTSLIDLQKEQIEVMNDNLEELADQLTLLESREWLFFEFIEKIGSQIIDVYEFINEKNVFKDPEFKRILIENMMHSHKKYKEEKSK
jgi:hypothetical protein